MEKEKFIWNKIDLVQLRTEMDPLVDDAVLSVFNSGKKMEHFVSDLKKMASNSDNIHSDVPKEMQSFVENGLAYEFTDEDIKYFEQTHEIWKKNGMKFIFILFFRALPYTYMAEKPANVLRMTKLLKTHTERRIFETAQFVFDVMDEQWWTPEKRGILTALKIRIMHAAMRYLILQTKTNPNETDIITGEWESKWGNPISQEDLIATNQVFSLEFFKGMKMLGNELNSAEQEAWFHTWKIIGKIMGVKKDLIPKNVADGWKLQHTVYDHLFNDKTVAGIPLAKALVETLTHFHLSHKLVLLIMKQMLEDEQFPNCFERMLKPSYKTTYPELFEIHHSEEKKHEHKNILRDHFHEELKKHYHELQKHKSKYKSEEQHKGWFQKVVDWFMNLFGISKKEKQLIDKHIALIHNVLHHPETGNPVEKLKEEMIIDAMNAMGGIIISILTEIFEKETGKESGFRIPKTLKDNWALKG